MVKAMVGSYLGPNCLQRLSADDTSRQRVNSYSLFQAYREVPKFCQYCQLRQIRGDNYCAIRGAVFQCLINNLPPFNSLSSKDCILQKLSQAFRDPSSGLKHWTFANRLPFTSKISLDVMRSCLDSLYTKVCIFK